MGEHYYSVEQIAQMLSIHPKTIQRYIREGRLRAVKIGKSWRVTGHDLSLFTEENSRDTAEKPVLAKDKTKGSAVIDMAVSGKDEANRIIQSLTAAMNVKPPEYGQASMHAQFLESDLSVRLTLWGNVQFISAILSSVEVFINHYEEEAE